MSKLGRLEKISATFGANRIATHQARILPKNKHSEEAEICVIFTDISREAVF